MKRRGLTPFFTAALFCGALVLGSAAATDARARQDPPAETQETESKKQDRQAAKEARIAEYLRKREERRIRREQRAVEQEAARKAAAEEAERKRLADAEAAEKQQIEKAHAAEVASAERAARNGKGGRPASRSKLPRGLARAQEAVRNSRLGQDPSVQRYLELVEQQKASPQQLGAVGNFLAQAGMGREALAYYDVALNLDKRDAVLWINAGTLHRQAGRTGQAINAYMRALSIDSNNAVAHYNLGASFDSQGKYEEALEEYKIALRLDPDLGDPAVNPQAANNEHLIAVKLLLYKEQSGSLGIPLIDVPGGDLRALEDPQN